MRLLIRKLLLCPFYLLVLIVDLMGSLLRRIVSVKHQQKGVNVFRPGISVVIPERANKPMLRRCLESLVAACERLEEPVQIIVVVSESESDAYRDLVQEFPAEWIFRSRPLWFREAIAVGVDRAIHDWVYLLNSDMVVDPLALHEASKWRDPVVFAIASQIFFQDPSRRREETGLTEIRNVGKLLELHDIAPEDDNSIRSHAYAGGGSSLFQRSLLADFIERTKGYEPAYWEDVEWGVMAWRKAFRVLFCPQSKVWHAHRSTSLKFFSPEEIDRIFRRNRLRFQLRTGLPSDGLNTIFGSIARLDRRSYREMLQPYGMASTLWARLRCYLDPPISLESLQEANAHYGRPRRPGAPLVVIVSPYCIYPPAHGGARRIHALIEKISAEFDVVLLSDEAENYSEQSRKYFEACHKVCLIGGRVAPPKLHGRIARIHVHSRAAMAEGLLRIVRDYDPDIVQIEYVELAKLIEIRDSRPWLLTLHDVLIENRDRHSEEDQFELDLINRFDKVVVCGPEDRGLLSRDDVHVIPNGAHVTTDYSASPERAPILFLGPFRYRPNFLGIIEFLNHVFPAVRAKVPHAQIQILGGEDARATASQYLCFYQPGVTVFDFIEDVQPWLRNCALTINPDKEVRGSSLKVIESLAAGRVCVSTVDGARGLLESELRSLVVVNEIDFAERISELLTDVNYRHDLEIPTEAVHQYSWQRSSEEQARIYRSLLQDGYSARTYAFVQADMPGQ
jgi:GT2 family glycosyltransferase/glycosyltransferase involved in cell wall biosynthesis